MQGINRWVIAALLVAVLPAMTYAGGGKSIGKDSGIVPVHLEEIPGSDIKKVVLTADAAMRCGIVIVPVQELQVPVKRKSSDKVMRRVVPYASIIYTPDGGEWVYTSPSNLSFVRERVSIAYIDADIAVLEHQLTDQKPLHDEEVSTAITVDTSKQLDINLLKQRINLI